MRTPLKTAGTALVIALLSLVLLEGAMAVALWTAPRLPPESATGQFLRNYYLAHVRHIPQFMPECAQYDPRLTYTLKPGGCAFENEEFSVRMEVNSGGFRDDEESLHRPDVIVAGDSHAMGWGVAQQDTFAQVLERETGLKVLNTAVSSYGTARELMAARSTDHNAARFIIIAYNSNDFVENVAFVAGNGRLSIQSRAEYDALVAQHQRTIRYFPAKHVLNLAGDLLQDAAPPAPPVGAPSSLTEAQTFVEVLKLFSDVLVGKIVIVTALEEQGSPHTNFIRSLAFVLANTEEIPFAKDIRLTDALSHLDGSDFFPLDGHTNAAAHAQIAELLQARMGTADGGDANERRYELADGDFRVRGHSVTHRDDPACRLTDIRRVGGSYVVSGSIATPKRGTAVAFLDETLIAQQSLWQGSRPEFSLPAALLDRSARAPALFAVWDDDTWCALRATEGAERFFSLRQDAVVYGYALRPSEIVTPEQEALAIKEPRAGYVEFVSDEVDRLRIVGWASDGSVPRSIVGFAGSTPVFATIPVIDRPDVVASTGAPSPTLGFTAVIEEAVNDNLRVFATYDGNIARELNYNATYGQYLAD